MAENEPKPLTKNAVDSAPELTIEDVATEDEKAIIDAKKTLVDAIEQTKANPGAAMESVAIEAAALISHQNPAEWVRIRSSLKSQGVSLRILDKLVRKSSMRVLKGGAAATVPLNTGMYKVVNGAICFERNTQNGSIITPLSNFIARIICEQLRDDGSGEVPSRIFEIEGMLQNGEILPRIFVPSDHYPSMTWVIQGWGPQAIVSAGFSLRDHLRTGIQSLSGPIPRRTVFAHLGWHKKENQCVFVHAGGAIGPVGPINKQYRLEDVYLPRDLQNYCLPDLPSRSDLQKAVIASLKLFDLAPDEVSIPLIAAIYRAPLGIIDFAIHLSGPTGVGKSELAAICQQYYGAGMDARHLPASWSSTANALEALLYIAKDSLIVIDDFCPTGSQSDIQRFHRDADRVLRAQGNNSGRARMNAESNLRQTKYPRGLVMSTGEEVFRGQSLRARVLNLELGPGKLNFALLSAAQSEASAGIYAQAFVGYINWLTPRINKIQQTLRQDVAKHRTDTVKDGQHRRTSDIVASLVFGFQTFLDFAYNVGAINEAKKESLWNRGRDALYAAGDAQQSYQRSSEPTQRFLELLGACVASGSAHIASKNGQEPKNGQIYGWRSITIETPDRCHTEWHPQGKRIGWIDGNNLYLDPDISYTLAQEFAKNTGEGLIIGSTTLHKRLQERGLLKTIDIVRGKLIVRVTLDGARRSVLHLDSSCLPEPAQSAQSANSTTNTEEGSL